VIHVQHVSTRRARPSSCPTPRGVEIHGGVAPLAARRSCAKHFPTASARPRCSTSCARGISGLVIAGMMTHMCVDTTVRAAFDLGFGIQLAHDACATRDLAFGGRTVAAADVHAAFVAALNGLFARSATAGELCAAL